VGCVPRARSRRSGAMGAIVARSTRSLPQLPERIGRHCLRHHLRSRHATAAPMQNVGQRQRTRLWRTFKVNS
jgi:hypothetical protein